MKIIDVAIIIVSYRSAALTIDCLRSIESQPAVPGLRLRCVVVDNASGDSPAIAEAVSRHGWSSWVRLVTAQRNGGFAYGNNLGVRTVYADGRPDYLHLVNPDTVLRQGAVDALVRFLERNPTAGIAGSSFENADGSDWAIAFRFPTLLGEVERSLHIGLASRLLRRWQVTISMGREPCSVDWVSGASMMIRRDLLDAIGGMDEAFFLYFEETEFCFRAKAAGASVWYVPESRVMHIAGQSTKVTERNLAPRRLPGYWFESRRRYFARTGGTGYAVAVDLASLLAAWVCGVKCFLQRRGSSEAPHFLRDMLAHSLLWPRNRRAEASVDAVPRF